MKNIKIAHIAWAVCLLVGIVLSLKSVREPDLWWMYRTGEWMIENGTVTKSDPFSYTQEGTEWINVKWLFEIIIVFFKRIFGPEGIFVLQALVSLGILSAIYRSSHLIICTIYPEENKFPSASVVFTALLVLFSIDYRLIGRPEMTSHLLTASYLYLFWNYHYNPNSKIIFALIPLQLFWTNMHEAFGIGMILMFAYLAATWVQYFVIPKKIRPKNLSAAVIGALVVITLNPRGYQMWLHPFNIFGQLSDNQYTTELASIWKAAYWQEIHAYLNLFFAAISIVFLALSPILYRQKIRIEELIKIPSKKKGKKATTKTKAVLKDAPIDWGSHWIEQYGLGNLLLVAILLYLSTTAYRNIPFFIIAAAPIFATAIEWLFKKIKSPKWLPTLGLAVGAMFYLSIITGKYHKWTNSRDQYGLQILSSHNPVGAANFIKEHKIQGRCFADYLTSAYLLWDLQPDFKTYIDLRDLDIYTKAFFEEFTVMTAMPDKFDNVDDSLGFDYVVLFRPQYQNLQKHLLESPKYDLVFVDPVAAVYVKRTEETDALIAQYGFAKNKAPDIYSSFTKVPNNSVAYFISKLFNPLYHPTDYTEINQDALAGSYYMSIHNPTLALERAKKAILGPEPWKGYDIYGNIFNFLAFDQATADSLRGQYRSRALAAYDQALAANPSYIASLTGKASIMMQQGNFMNALPVLDEAFHINPRDLGILQYLGICYKNLSFQSNQHKGYAKKWLEYTQAQNNVNPNNPLIQLDLGLAHCFLGNCSKSHFFLKDLVDLPGLSPEEIKVAKNCLKNCSF